MEVFQEIGMNINVLRNIENSFIYVRNFVYKCISHLGMKNYTLRIPTKYLVLTSKAFIEALDDAF